MLIDVLLPFHRDDAFLDKALNSLADSRNVKLRVILIDDSESQNFDPSRYSNMFDSIELAKTSGGTGYGNALRCGSEYIESEAVGLFNSDDLIHPTRFEKQLRALSNHELSITGISRIDSVGRNSAFLTGDITSKAYHPIYLLLGAYGANASWLMHRQWWADNAFFDEEPALDWRIALKAFVKTNIHWNPEKLYFYRKHNNQVTAGNFYNSNDLNAVFQEWLKLSIALNVGSSNEEIFQIFAMPWMRRRAHVASDLRIWAKDLLEKTQEIDPSIYANIRTLVQRRYLFSAIDRRTIDFAQIQLLMMATPQIGPVIRDVFMQHEVFPKFIKGIGV